MRKLLIAAAGLIVVLALFLFVALRDNSARQADGDRRIAGVESGRIHYFVGGPPDGSVVVLVPSYARSASDFNELVSALRSAGHRTIAVQPRGIDGSSATFGTTLHTFAQDLDHVLTAESVTLPVVVVGHAYGNRVARAFATGFPRRTRALVLLAAGGVEPTPPEMTSAIGRAVFGIYPEQVRREAIELAFFAPGNPVPGHWMRGWYPLAGIGQIGANTTPYAEWGEGGSAPILVVQPAEDAVAASGGPELARRHPDRVTLVTVEKAGHALLPEQPETVARAVVDFLEALP